MGLNIGETDKSFFTLIISKTSNRPRGTDVIRWRDLVEQLGAVFWFMNDAEHAATLIWVECVVGNLARWQSNTGGVRIVDFPPVCNEIRRRNKG